MRTENHIAAVEDIQVNHASGLPYKHIYCRVWRASSLICKFVVVDNQVATRLSPTWRSTTHVYKLSYSIGTVKSESAQSYDLFVGYCCGIWNDVDGWTKSSGEGDDRTAGARPD